MTSSWIRLAAFFGRAFRRSVGIRVDYEAFEQVEARSRRYLELLRDDRSHFQRRVALENLGREWDLLDEESEGTPAADDLLLRLVELAGSDPDCRELVARAFSESPVSRLVAAIFAQAKAADVRVIRLSTPDDASDMQVLHNLPNGWTEELTIPMNLAGLVRKQCKRIERIGSSRIRRFQSTGTLMLPESVHFDWSGSKSFDIALPAAGSAKL